MANKKRFRKKELRNHLTGMLMIHLNVHLLPKNKSKKLNSYLDKKLSPIVDYYVRLLSKKRAKKMIRYIKQAAISKLEE